MKSFEYNGALQRVILESNAIDRVAQEVRDLGAHRALVICGGNTRRGKMFQLVVDRLGDLCADVFDDVVEHSSTVVVTEGASRAQSLGIDVLIAVGGGSASDSAKGIAIMLAEGGKIEQHASRFEPPDRFIPTILHQPKLPIISIPTTASAAEVTPGLGIRVPTTGAKLLFWDVKLASRVILLDPVANLEVPAGLMASTAMNAFAHCAEGLYSRLRNPISEGIALQGARILTHAIPAMVQEPENPTHRANVMAGAYLSGLVISNARVGIHHAVCHCLGALGRLSHGTANSVMLPHALGYNIDFAAAELRGLAEAMGVAVAGLSDAEAAHEAINAVSRLQIAAGVPNRLRDTGLDHALLPQIAEHTLHDRGLFFNPRRTENAEPILAMLERAW